MDIVGIRSLVAVGALVVSCASFSAPRSAVAATAEPRDGSITGRVVARAGEQPVSGAAVRVVGLDVATTTDDRGAFTVANVPPGQHDLAVSAEGYLAGGLQRVSVRDGEATSVVVVLEPRPVKLEEQVEVVGQLPRRSEAQPGTAFTLTGTRLTTISGTMGDFGRTLRTIPAAAGTSDERNTIVARGGNPIENGFFIDNIQVPNIVHLPDYGSSGGFYSLVDPSAVGSFDFVVGGFPAKFGGFLSSVTDIAYREGSRDAFRGQARFDLAMAAAAAEGPLPGRRGSWRVSLRRADFVYLKEIIELNNASPQWTDAHVKVVYDLSPRHSLSFLDIFSSDRVVDHGGSSNERTAIDQNTAGVSWRAQWSETLRSETSLSHSRYNRDRGVEYQPPEDPYNWADRRETEWFALRNENTRTLGSSASLQFGVQARRYTQRSRYLTLPTRPGIIWISQGPWEYRTTDADAFVMGTLRMPARLRTTAGLRVEHSTASGRTHVSPRLSASYQLHTSWQVHGAAAIVHQTLPDDFLAINPSLIAAPDMRADQYSVGVSFTGLPGWRATAEAYHKSYSNLPIDSSALHRLILDREPFRDYTVPVSVVSTGTGRTYGVEIMVERRIGRQFSAVFAGRVSRNTYQDANGIERNRLFDSRYGVSMVADWTPTDRWSLSSSLVVQDGTPYTPTNPQASMAYGTWVRNGNLYNGVRYPTYATLNARIERRFSVGRTTLAVFGDIWNLLDRENTGWIKGWNSGSGDEWEYQMPRTPFVGVGIIF